MSDFVHSCVWLGVGFALVPCFFSLAIVWAIKAFFDIVDSSR